MAVLFNGVLNGVPSHASSFVERDTPTFPPTSLLPRSPSRCALRTGKGEDFRTVEEYRVDTATIAEIRDIQKQAAQELGQWIKRTESLDLNQLFERMSDAEMEAVINHGTQFSRTCTSKRTRFGGCP